MEISKALEYLDPQDRAKVRRGLEALEVLQAFADQADTMWSLSDHEKICGVAVSNYRRAARLCRP